MQCDFCNNEATIEIVIFVNGEAKKVRMCASCYQEKLSEMMENMPKDWGGKQLTDQIRSMLEKAEADGTLLQGMEFSIHPENISPEDLAKSVSAFAEAFDMDDMHDLTDHIEHHFHPMHDDLDEEMPTDEFDDQIAGAETEDNTHHRTGDVDAAHYTAREDATEEDEFDGPEVGEDHPFRFNPFAPLFSGSTPPRRKNKEDNTTSARDKAFAQQRRQLKHRREVLTQKMQVALQAEDYEKCAAYRDQLDEIGDALIRLNEERKDPYGV